MSKIRVDLESVKVIEGQGVGEGDFELRVTVGEGGNKLVWPSANGSTKVEKDVVHGINEEVATYTVNSGTLSKKFTIDVTEVDKGTLGQDDQGHGTVTLDLAPAMTPVTKGVDISLKRPDMGYQGKVNVKLSAQVD